MTDKEFPLVLQCHLRRGNRVVNRLPENYAVRIKEHGLEGNEQVLPKYLLIFLSFGMEETDCAENAGWTDFLMYEKLL